MKLLKSIAAVIVGYATFVVAVLGFFYLSGRDFHAAQPLWFMGLATVYGVLVAAGGGFVGAKLAPSRPRLHACITALILAAGAAASLTQSPATDATWSMWGALLLMAPACCAGGFLVE